MAAIEYRENDIVGQETLEVISSARKFNDWMYRTIRPFCKGKILEIGSGIGNISVNFLNDGYSITLSDVRSHYYDFLKNKFSSCSNLEAVLMIDLVNDEFDTVYAGYLEKYDSLVALNVIEHIENDRLAIHNCKKLIKPGGTIIILAPAYQHLYNRFDKELSHYRRYDKKLLQKLFNEENLKLIESKYFNFMGIPGWYISGKLQMNKSIPRSQMKFYDKLVPVFKVIDKLVFNKIGLSVITIGKKDLN